MTMHPRSSYSAEAIHDPDGLTDVRIHIQDKTWHMWGRRSRERETGLAESIDHGTLPVLLGSGLGHCLRTLIDRGRPVAVVDRESAILEHTGLKQACNDLPNVLWLDDDSPQTVMDALTSWQRDHDGLPFKTITIPLYMRLDRAYYKTIGDTLKDSTQTDFWSRARYPKFQSAKPRILFFDSNYFLCNEISASLQRLDMEHRSLPLDGSGTGSQDFIERLLKTILDFKPDFVLTVNHFGLDREGKLANLLNDLELPLASWFVDNPHLIIHEYAHPGTDNTVVFTYDAGNLDTMREKGFANVHYLPLATDPHRFKPELPGSAPTDWHADLSFVGNSMTNPVTANLENTGLPTKLVKEYETVAAAFGESGRSNVAAFLETHAPDWAAPFAALPAIENRLAVESLITWEATRQYRLSCIRAIMTYSPLIVGDNGWRDLLGPTNGWRHLQPIDYYADLPRFYQCSKINFNCTSRQMPGAVNQRVFDIPACGGFVLTDSREQMDRLFDPGCEVIAYTTIDEIPELIGRYMADEKARKTVADAARKRILAHHTYDIRLNELVTTMRSTA